MHEEKDNEDNENLERDTIKRGSMFLPPFLCFFVPFCGCSSCGFLQKATLSNPTDRLIAEYFSRIE